MILENNNKSKDQEATYRAVFNFFGLSEKHANEAIQNKLRPLPRTRRHYNLEDAKGVMSYPSKTIDEAVEICKAHGIKADEKELRRGIKLPDGSFIRDVYDESSRMPLSHEEN